MITVPIRFPEEMYQNLRALSDLTGKSMAEIVRESLDKEVKSKPKKVKKKLEYKNPLLEMAKNAKKIAKECGADNYYYPEYTDDELIYLEKWKKKDRK